MKKTFQFFSLEGLFINIVMMIQIRKATPEDAAIIRLLAEAIWWPTYSSIISKEQIRFMLDHIYDLDTIMKQIQEEEQTYLMLFYKEQPVCFASYAPKEETPGIFKLHKIYCLPETQGKGFGKALLHEVEKAVLENGKNILELNVNRHNPAKEFYEKMGYKVAYEEDIPIGPYWMNDYVMRKILKNIEE